MAVYAGAGTKLLIGVNAIAELTSISGLEIKGDTIETTTYDTGGWRTFIQGLKDGGEVSMSGFFYPGDTNGQKSVYDALVSGASNSFTITFPASMGAQWTFSGVVTAFSTAPDMEQSITFEATIKVSGQPSLGLTASGGLTALTLTGTSGVLSPTFNNGIYTYSWVFSTSTTITVTATAANHTLKLYVDGNYVQDLTSGSASSTIAFASVGSKKLSVISYESGKTSKVYEIAAVRST